MNWVKGFALVTCLATPLPVIMAVSASAEPGAASGTARVQLAAMTAEQKAKAADCSKQADEKKLHGTERKKFRATCIKG